MNTRFFAALRMTTLLVGSLLFVICSYSQATITNPDGSKVVQDENGGWKFIDPPPVKYQYYFLMISTTGKLGVLIEPEWGVNYPDIDSLIVSKREQRKKNDVITGKKYESYSEAFNSLSNAGLEFVQFVNLSTVGGGTAMLVGDIRINYTMWRRRIY